MRSRIAFVAIAGYAYLHFLLCIGPVRTPTSASRWGEPRRLVRLLKRRPDRVAYSGVFDNICCRQRLLSIVVLRIAVSNCYVRPQLYDDWSVRDKGARLYPSLSGLIILTPKHRRIVLSLEISVCTLLQVLGIVLLQLCQASYRSSMLAGWPPLLSSTFTSSLWSGRKRFEGYPSRVSLFLSS
jgi:hypothetical protein